MMAGIRFIQRLLIEMVNSSEKYLHRNIWTGV